MEQETATPFEVAKSTLASLLRIEALLTPPAQIETPSSKTRRETATPAKYEKATR